MKSSRRTALGLAVVLAVSGCTAYLPERESNKECIENLRLNHDYVCKEDLADEKRKYTNREGWDFPGISIYGLFRLIGN